MLPCHLSHVQCVARNYRSMRCAALAGHSGAGGEGVSVEKDDTHVSMSYLCASRNGTQHISAQLNTACPKRPALRMHMHGDLRSYIG